jgi:uncharacterized membrane protein YdfJ with MMPL/SSD domain
VADAREERSQAPPPGSGLIVRIVAGPAAGREIQLGAEALVLGRAGSAVPGLAEDHELSRLHARISRFDGRLLVEDLGSTNGTFVNGEPVAGPTVVGPGDVVWLGNTTLLVQGSEEAPPAVAPAEPPMPSPQGGLLARIAEVSDRYPKRILVGLFIFFVFAVVVGAPAVKRLTDERGFDPPKSEYVLTQDRIAAARGSFTVPLIALIQDNQDVNSPRVRADVERIANAMRREGSFDRIRTAYNSGGGAPSLISRDGKATYLLGFYKDVNQATREKVADRIRKKFEDQPRITFASAPATLPELRDQVRSDLQKSERYGIPILFLLSIFVFRGVVAALLPIIVGVVAIFGTFLSLRGLNAIPGVDINVFALNVVIALGLGLSIDYSLFVVSRYREELARVGKGREHTESYGAIPRPSLEGGGTQPFTGSEREALRRTMMTAGRTILFSAMTVAVAMGSLIVFEQPFIRSIGIGGAVCSLVAVFTALVALPALLAALGPRVNAGAPKRWKLAAERTARLEQRGFWYRLSQAVMRSPGPVALLSAALLIAIGIAFFRIEFTGVNSHTIPHSLGAFKADTVLTRDFASNPDATINVLIEAPASAAGEVQKYAVRLGNLRDVAFVVPPIKLKGALWEVDLRPWTDGLDKHSIDLVHDIRNMKTAFPKFVTGEPAGFIDQQKSFRSRLPLAAAILVVATLVILFLMTGSAVLPVKSLVMNMLTLAAALGVLVLVFQDGRLEKLLGYSSLGKLDASQPILIVAIAFGLSTDYAVFLLTRIAEARAAGASDNEAVAIGLQRTGRIVTQAALLFCVAVGAFVTSKVLFIKEVGLGMITAVIVDSTIVRGLLVPSLMAMLGARNWWAPKSLRWLHEKIGLSEG